MLIGGRRRTPTAESAPPPSSLAGTRALHVKWHPTKKKKRRIEIEFIHEATMRRRYLPPHKVAKLADPSAKQTGIAYHHLFSFFQGLLLHLLPPFISSLFSNCFLSFRDFVFCLCVIVCWAAFRALFFFFREGCFLFFGFSAARDCHSNHDFASWLIGALLSLNRYFRHLRMCARLHYVVKCVFLYLASPLRVFFLFFLQRARCLLMRRLSETFPEGAP